MAGNLKSKPKLLYKDSNNSITLNPKENFNAEKLDNIITTYSNSSKDHNLNDQPIKLEMKMKSEQQIGSLLYSRETIKPQNKIYNKETNETNNSQWHQKLSLDFIYENEHSDICQDTSVSCETNLACLSESFPLRKESVTSVPKVKNAKYSCKQCSYKTARENLYLKHLNCHEKKEVEAANRKKFVCEICGFEARLQREYKQHIEAAHPINYSCAQCPYKTCKKVYYLRHVRNVHENKRPFPCSVCQLAFKRRDALKQHQVVHSRDDKARVLFKCDVCKKVVRSAAYLREHMFTHSEERSFLCEICGASFKTRSVHRNHLRAVHSQELQAHCKFCGKTFATKFSLKRHVKQHENSLTSNEKMDDSIGYKHDQKHSNSEWNEALPETSVPDRETKSSPARSDKDIVYADFAAADNFNLSIDNQIPYIIHSTQEVTSE